jgi:hypothetical protein
MTESGASSFARTTGAPFDEREQVFFRNAVELLAGSCGRAPFFWL